MSKRATNAPGAKALITAGAIAATLAGWAMIDYQTPSENTASITTVAPEWLQQPPQIPLLPTVAAADGAAPAPQLIVNQPAQVAPVAPTLREVNPQPQAIRSPITTTRSSR